MSNCVELPFIFLKILKHPLIAYQSQFNSVIMDKCKYFSAFSYRRCLRCLIPFNCNLFSHFQLIIKSCCLLCVCVCVCVCACVWQRERDRDSRERWTETERAILRERHRFPVGILKCIFTYHTHIHFILFSSSLSFLWLYFHCVFPASSAPRLFSTTQQVWYACFTGNIIIYLPCVI